MVILIMRKDDQVGPVEELSCALPCLQNEGATFVFVFVILGLVFRIKGMGELCYRFVF